MKTSLLRWLMMLDAAVLTLLGLLMIFQAQPIELAFGFKDLPVGVSYLLGLWGCGLLTLGLGYAVASNDPPRHVLWIVMAIGRGALECVFGLVCLARGIVTPQQSATGIILAALITVAYIVLYPRASQAAPVDAKGQAIPPQPPQPPGAPPPFSGPTAGKDHGK